MSQQKKIDALQADYQQVCKDKHEWMKRAQDAEEKLRIIDQISAAPIAANAIYEMQQRYQWIPCSERMPDAGFEVLAKLKWLSGKVVKQVIVRVDADDHTWECDGSELSHSVDVIEWMELPE